jgi:spore coat polysaccharide biosynthesis protein SpsF (cytidylyltransferase family)
MRTRAGIILQARFGSSRLPGKALERIGDCSIVERCLRRLVAGGVAHVVLATTERPDDDALADIAARLGVLVYRGAEHDVLGRYAQAVTKFDLDPVVRATGDNPFVDIQAPGRLLAALRSEQAEYVREEGLAFGGGVEAFTAAALSRAAARANSPYDREHVTTFMRRNPDLFRTYELAAPAPLWRPLLRLSIDTRQDLAWVRELFLRTGVEEPTMAQLIAAAGRTAHSKAA